MLSAMVFESAARSLSNTMENASKIADFGVEVVCVGTTFKAL